MGIFCLVHAEAWRRWASEDMSGHPEPAEGLRVPVWQLDRAQSMGVK